MVHASYLNRSVTVVKLSLSHRRRIGGYNRVLDNRFAQCSRIAPVLAFSYSSPVSSDHPYGQTILRTYKTPAIFPHSRRGSVRYAETARIFHTRSTSIFDVNLAYSSFRPPGSSLHYDCNQLQGPLWSASNHGPSANPCCTRGFSGRPTLDDS